MKAVQINRYGGTDVIEIKNDIQKPFLKESQLLIQIKAVSINPFDVTVRSGNAQKYLPLRFPSTIGGDFAGVISEIGSGVSEFKVGDEVYGQASVANGGSGSFAEFVAANTKNTALKPKSIDFVQAASLPLVGSSVIQALEEHIKLQKGQKILIHGGVGGIGSIAIQVAKYLGAYVTTTVSSESKEFAKKLGADEVIDYKSQHFEELIKNYDAVYDTVGGEITNTSMKVLKNGGILVTMIGQPDEELAKKLDVTVIKQFTNSNTQKLNRLTELIDSGKIITEVDRVFSLDQVKEAFNYFEKGHPKGKVVLTVK